MGQTDANGKQIFPPLWGPHSFNWGAGMHKVSSAAAFIQHNMPLSQPGKLNAQDVWDVAAFIDSKPRPKDPRQSDGISLQEADKKWHKSSEDYYGETMDGVVLGTGYPNPESASTQSN